jgi:hypothetical protein
MVRPAVERVARGAHVGAWGVGARRGVIGVMGGAHVGASVVDARPGVVVGAACGARVGA